MPARENTYSEPPDYAHVCVEIDRVVIHQRSFLYDGPIFSLHDSAALNRTTF